jgi:hypothetical protein
MSRHYQRENRIYSFTPLINHPWECKGIARGYPTEGYGRISLLSFLIHYILYLEIQTSFDLCINYGTVVPSSGIHWRKSIAGLFSGTPGLIPALEQGSLREMVSSASMGMADPVQPNAIATTTNNDS